MKRKMTQRNKSILVLAVFDALLIGVVIANYGACHAFQSMGLMTVASANSLLFLLIGMVLLGISAFTFLALSAYQTGKLFAVYSLLIGLSIALAPCAQLSSATVNNVNSILAILSSLLLYRTIGQLTLLNNKKIYKVLWAILLVIILVAIASQIASLIAPDATLTAMIAAESVGGSVILAAVFSVLVMAFYYRRSNSYSKKQIRVLLASIGAGIVLYALAYMMPMVYVVRQASVSEGITNIEISFLPETTLLYSIPLLVLSGINVAIIFMLLRREFIHSDTLFKLRHFIFITSFIFLANCVPLIYLSCSLGAIFFFNLVLISPFCIAAFQALKSKHGNAEEGAYQRRLLEELETEREHLSSYLHDEILQSLIAVYRKLHADNSGQFDDTTEHLSKLISQVRSESHNLYPTMVEDLGLEQSLLSFVDELQIQYSAVRITYNYKLTDGILPKALALAFYRIAKELATNAAKHSGGGAISILLNEDAEGYYIRVNDNGHGFSLPNNEDLLSSPHMGLYNVKKLIAGLQGRLSFNSGKEAGTDYYIYIPLKGASA